jgi:hypothetical protein
MTEIVFMSVAIAMAVAVLCWVIRDEWGRCPDDCVWCKEEEANAEHRD